MSRVSYHEPAWTDLIIDEMIMIGFYCSQS